MDVPGVTTSSTLTALLRGTLVDPADITARLVYADCLSENDQHERAELIRVQVELSRTNPAILEMVRGIPKREWDAPEYSRVKELLNREDELLDSLIVSPDDPTWRNGFARNVWLGVYGENVGHIQRVYTNGFVSRVSLPTSLFLAHAATLFAAHPITSVTLTDREPASGGTVTGSNHGWWRATLAIIEADGQDRDLIPARLWEFISSTIAPSFWKCFPTRSLALSALSLACVNYGRQLADLPPLNDNTPAG